MPSSYTRRRFLASSGIALGVTTAGCLADSTDEPGSTDTTDTTSGTSTVSPSELPAEVAKDRALAAEERYLEAQLRDATCLDDWGTSATTVSERATVVDRTADGVYVEVTHPYWYSTGNSHADLGSEARYLVTEETTRRLGGEDVSPC